MSKIPHSTKDQKEPLSTIDFANRQGNNIGEFYNKSVIKHRAFWPFLILILAVLILAGWYFKTQLLEKHFAVDIPDSIKKSLELDEFDQERAIAELKDKDTDQDGLSDYQELYQYHTSMFLEDTDSDGYTDLEEINSGNDPICPAGEDCNLLHLITPTTNLADVVEEVSLDTDLTIQDAALLEFRGFLLENGFTQEEVDQLSDDDLLAIFSILAESEIGQENQDNEVTTEQVRAFLLAQPGANEEAINNLSEEELLDIRNRLVDV
jgi:hypothetical protein